MRVVSSTQLQIKRICQGHFLLFDTFAYKIRPSISFTVFSNINSMQTLAKMLRIQFRYRSRTRSVICRTDHFSGGRRETTLKNVGRVRTTRRMPEV